MNAIVRSSAARRGSLGTSLIVVVLTTLVLAACGTLDTESGVLDDGEISTSITWGQPTHGAYDHVGTLLVTIDGEWRFDCSGTMIAPRVMLTAAHCVDGAGNVNDATYVRFDADAMSGIDDYGTLQGWLDAEWIAAEAVIPHPEWDSFAAFPDTFDIGVVILPEDAAQDPSSGFAEIPDLGFLEDLRGSDRQHFVNVGYGLQGTLRPFFMNVYERYQGAVRLLEVNSRISGTQSARFSNNPGIGGGNCYADSGGPTFFQDTNLLVSIASFRWAKNGYCIGNDFNFRTDTPAAQTFIDDMLDLYGE